MEFGAQLEAARLAAAARHEQERAAAGPSSGAQRSPEASPNARASATHGDTAAAAARAPRAAASQAAAAVGRADSSPEGGSAPSSSPGARAGGAPREARGGARGVLRGAASLLGRALVAALRPTPEDAVVPTPPPQTTPVPSPPPAFAVGQRVTYHGARGPERAAVTAVERGRYEAAATAYTVRIESDGRVVNTDEAHLRRAFADSAADDAAARRAAELAAQEEEDERMARALQAEEDARAAGAAAPGGAASGSTSSQQLGESIGELMTSLLGLMAVETANSFVEVPQPAQPGGSGTREYVMPTTGVRVTLSGPGADMASALLGSLVGVGVGRGGARAPGVAAFPGFPFGDGALSYEALLALQERLGGAMPRGATEEQVAALPTRRYVRRTAPEGGAAAGDSSESTCSICLADFEEGEEQRALPCAHAFHTPCIDQWLKSSRACPCCRHEIA